MICNDVLVTRRRFKGIEFFTSINEIRQLSGDFPGENCNHADHKVGAIVWKAKMYCANCSSFVLFSKATVVSGGAFTNSMDWCWTKGLSLLPLGVLMADPIEYRSLLTGNGVYRKQL